MGARDELLLRRRLDQLREAALGREIDRRGAAAEVAVDRAGPGRAGELGRGDPEKVDVLAGILPARRDAAGDVVDDAEHTDDRRREDGGVAGLVVEADVAAGHGDAELEARVGEAVDGLPELPHDLGVLGAAEVQAVGDGGRHSARDGDVAVRLGEGELCAGVGVELAVAAVAVGRDRKAETRLLVDADHARIVGERQGRVAHDVVVVLIGDPRGVGEVGAAEEGLELLLEHGGVVGAGEGGGRVELQRVDPGRVGDRALVDGAVDGDRRGVDVDDLLAVPEDLQASVAGDLAEHRRLDIPLARHREEGIQLLGRDDRHHALLRLAHEDLLGSQRGVAQQDVLEVDAHTRAAVRGELAGRARDARGAEVLDGLDEFSLVELETALDEHLLGEGVAHLHGGALGGAAVGEGVGCQDRRPADAVAARARPEQDDLVAGAGGVGELDVLVAHDADGEGVDEGVALVDRVEDGLAADVRQAQAVRVGRDARDDAVDHARRVGVGDVTEAQLVHDGDGARTHRDDVADDPADAGRGALEGLDVARVVVRLDLERDGPALADVDDAGVLAHADHEALFHLVADLLAEAAQVDLRRLVRAMLRPHDGVHRELARRRAAPEDRLDLLVLVGLEAQRRVRLLLVGRLEGVFDSVCDGRAHAAGLQDSGCRRGMPQV